MSKSIDNSQDFVWYLEKPQRKHFTNVGRKRRSVNVYSIYLSLLLSSFFSFCFLFFHVTVNRFIYTLDQSFCSKKFFFLRKYTESVTLRLLNEPRDLNRDRIVIVSLSPARIRNVLQLNPRGNPNTFFFSQ